MATFVRRHTIALAALLMASLASLPLLGQAASQARQSPEAKGRGRADFRHFPGGKSVPGLDGGRSVDGPLAAEANRELPSGFRVLRDASPVVAQMGGNLLYRFALEYDGIRLAGDADYVVVLNRGRRIVASRIRNLPESVDDTRPAITAAAAAATAAGEARRRFGVAGTVAIESLRLEIWVDSQARGRLTWSLIARSGAGGLRRSFNFRVSARTTAEVLEARELRFDATLHAQANIWQSSPLAPTIVAPLPDLRLISNGAVGPITDANGDATVAVGIASASLIGPYARVWNEAGVEISATAQVTGGGNDTLDFAVTDDFGLAQTTAFVWASYANRWVRTFAPTLNQSSVMNNLQVFVNAVAGCNGYSDGAMLTLGRATASCRNMATPTIIVHEFGHVVHVQLSEGVFDAAYSEGFSDALSAFITGDTCLGRDTVAGFCFRDVADVTLYPPADGEAHAQGQPYAQFSWALAVDRGVETAAALILGAAAGAPIDIPDAVQLSFVVDDDDGDLGTCSANQRALEQAADSRTLPRPADCADVATTLTSVTPASPGSSNTPTFRGTTAPGVPVGLFSTAGCTGSALNTGIADATGAFAITLTVNNNSTTTVYAKALLTDGRTGACSNGMTYVQRPPSVTISDASIFEGRAGTLSTLTFGVSLTDPATGPVTVSFATSNGTAVSTNDYQARTGSVSFAPGEKAKSITVAVVGDGVVEKDETIALRISASGAPVLRATALGTITNDDNVGVATLLPSAATARARDVVPFEFGWVVPASKPDGTTTNNHWRDLTTMKLRLVDQDGRTAFEVIWIQATNTFQASRASGTYSKPFAPGPGGDVQETPFFALDPGAIVVRTAPGPALSLVLPLRAKQAAIGKTFRVEGAATDDFGDEQPFEILGTLAVVP